MVAAAARMTNAAMAYVMETEMVVAAAVASAVMTDGGCGGGGCGSGGGCGKRRKSYKFNLNRG